MVLRCCWGNVWEAVCSVVSQVVDGGRRRVCTWDGGVGACVPQVEGEVMWRGKGVEGEVMWRVEVEEQVICIEEVGGGVAGHVCGG